MFITQAIFKCNGSMLDVLYPSHWGQCFIPHRSGPIEPLDHNNPVVDCRDQDACAVAGTVLDVALQGYLASRIAMGHVRDVPSDILTAGNYTSVDIDVSKRAVRFFFEYD